MKTLAPIRTILVLAAVLPAVAAAQQELSLDDALRLAHDESHRLKAAGQAVEAAAAGVRTARAEMLPALGVVATRVDYDGDVFYARFVNPAAPGEPNPDAEPTDVGDFSATSAAVLKLTQTLYAGGALRSRVRAGQVERRIAEEDQRQQRLDLDYDVTRAYYDVLLAEQAVEVARQSVSRSQETLDAVRRRRAAEEALAVEELGAESHLAADRHRLLAAENDARFARLELRRLLAGAPAAAQPRLTEALERPPRQLDEEQAVRLARDRHPALARGELRVALAEEHAAGARAHFRPKLELEGYHAWIDSETFFEGTTYGFDVKVSIPFFRDVAAGGGARAQAAAARELERSALAEASSALELLARQAVRRAQEAYGAADVARGALDYQREKHRVTASAFREQLVTAGDLMSEHAALAEAELRFLAAQHHARLAEAELDRSVGGPEP